MREIEGEKEQSQGEKVRGGDEGKKGRVVEKEG